ncbi:Dabb family protein [Xenorhabdus bovienii]|nr:Dabb family protein [Xenorhabdus bovienii]
MMIEHLVSYKFKNNLLDDDIKSVLDKLVSMPQSIPEIRHASWHLNSSLEGRDQGYCYLLRLEFDDQFQLEHYLASPAHTALCDDILFPALEDGLNSLIVFDITQ